MCVHASSYPVVTEPGLSQTRRSGWGRGRPTAFPGQGLGLLWAEARAQTFPAPRPQELLLTPALLEELTCARGSGELGRILTVSPGQQMALQGYRDAVCKGQGAARARRFSGLAAELHNQLDVAKMAQQVRSCLLASPRLHGAGAPSCPGASWAQGCGWGEPVAGCPGLPQRRHTSCPQPRPVASPQCAP